MTKEFKGTWLADSLSFVLTGSPDEDFKGSWLADSHAHGLTGSPYHA